MMAIVLNSKSAFKNQINLENCDLSELNDLREEKDLGESLSSTSKDLSEDTRLLVVPIS